MYNLPTPSHFPLDDYDRVASRRQLRFRTRLAAIRPDVAAAYETYERNANTLKSLKPASFDKSDREILRKNFNSLDKGAACAEIRSEILSTARQGKCPYCRLEEATTLDHILEKGTHPEFSILRTNLAPVCLRCNLAKENNAKLAKDKNLFHLYMQGYPVSDFLVSTPVIGRLGVTFPFALRAPIGLNVDQWEALTVHFQRLELSSRYQSRAQTEMQDRREEMLRVQRSGGPRSVQKFLRSVARSICSNWSEQDWLYVLLMGAASSDDFCDEGVHKL